MSLIWFAANNSVTLSDLQDLEVLGITVEARSPRAVAVYRDPITGRMVAEVGTVRAWRDGRVHIVPRTDCPDSALAALVQTALDCVERELHKRDRWHYSRATKDKPGRWGATILVAVREGGSLFAEHATVLGLASGCTRDADAPSTSHRPPIAEPAYRRPAYQTT